MNMRHSFLLPTAAFLLCATLVGADTCFAPENTVPWNGERTIKLSLGDWAACDINVQIAKILLTEKLGYKVEAVTDSYNAGGEAEVFNGLATGALDADLEVWFSTGKENFDRYVQTDQSVVFGGSSGVVGRNGWYVPSFMMTTTDTTDSGITCPATPPSNAQCAPSPNLDYWRMYTATSSTPAAVRFRREAADGATQAHLYGAKVNWGSYADTTSLIANLDIDAVHEAADDSETWTQRDDKVSAAIARNEPVLFYHWEPHSFHAEQDITRIMLPSTGDDCWAAKTCDFKMVFIGKLYNPKLNDANPDVAHFIRMFAITGDEQAAIMKAMRGGLTTFQAACNWIKTAGEATWSSWLLTVPDAGCPAGHYVGGQTCLKCPYNTYSDTISHAEECTRCPLNAGTAGIQGSVTREACGCGSGFFHENGTSYNGEAPCKPCVNNANCTGGHAPPVCRSPRVWVHDSSVSCPSCNEENEKLSLYEELDPTNTKVSTIAELDEQLEVRSVNGTVLRRGFTGFFIDYAHGKGAHSLKCSKNPSACIGRGNSTEGSLTNCSCTAGHRGVRCELCELGWYKTSSFECFQCPAAFSGEFATFVITMIFFTIGSLCYAVLMQMAKFRTASDKMAIAIKYLQNVMLMITFDLPWPPAFADFYATFDFMNFDIFGVVPLECSVSEGSQSRVLLLRLMMPVAMFIIFMFYYGILSRCSGKKSGNTVEDDTASGETETPRLLKDIKLLQKKEIKAKAVVGASEESEDNKVPKSKAAMWKRAHTHSKSVVVESVLKKKTDLEMRELYYRHCQAFVHFMMFTHLTYTKAFLGFFRCEKMADGVSYLVSDPSVVCFVGAEWLEALPLCVLGLALLVFGLPLWYLYICRAGRRRGFNFSRVDRSFFMKKVYQYTGEMADGGKEKLDALVLRFDVNKNGFLSVAEFNNLLVEIGLDLTVVQREQQMLELGSIQDEGDSSLGGVDGGEWKVPCDGFKKLIAGDHTVFDSMYRPVWLKFNEDYPWWDVFLSLQTIVIVAIQAIFNQEPYFASLMALYVLFAMFLAQVVLQPFKSKAGNDTAFFCGICILLTMIGGMASAGIESPSAESTEDSRAQASTVSTFTIIAVTAGAVLICRNAFLEIMNNLNEEYKVRMSHAITSIPLFSDCDKAFVSSIGARLTTEQHKQGHCFANIGDEGSCMWIIMEGSVKQVDKDGEVVIRTASATMTPAFGGLALITEEPREYTFTAETDVVVKNLSKASIKVCFAKHPTAEDAVLTAVLKKYNRTGGVDLSDVSNSDLLVIIQKDCSDMKGAARTVAEEKKRFAVETILKQRCIKQ